MSEKSNLETFSKLNLDTRIQLILASAETSISRQFLLRILGLVEPLSERDQQIVDETIFTLEVSPEKYQITGEQATQLDKQYGLNMGRAVILDYFEKVVGSPLDDE